MAWIGDGGSNSGLVNQLKISNILIEIVLGTGVFTAEKVREVMISVDRADFCSVNPYHDSPQTIGYGATISAPHMHAMALEGLLDVIKPDSHILDVGSGSGYLTACFAKLIGPNGTVVGIEHIDELVELSKRNLRKHHAKYLDNGQINIITGDGRKGYEPEAPYDAIHVGAAAGELPQALIDQLSIGGRMLIPVGNPSKGYQEFVAVERLQDGQVRKRTLAHVNYVPLTEKEAQLNGRHR